jgi:Ala-tRNA(Pro) deacylase
VDQAPRAEKVSTPLPAPEEREAKLARRLHDLSITFVTHVHEPVFTVEEARALRGALAGGHTKNLFLKDKKNAFWLVVAREDLRVDLNALARQLGAPRFSFASNEALERLLGVPAGSVTPFALFNDRGREVQVVLDENLLTLEPLNFHPLRNDRTTAIAATDLVRFIRACGHEPKIMSLPERP